MELKNKMKICFSWKFGAKTWVWIIHGKYGKFMVSWKCIHETKIMFFPFLGIWDIGVQSVPKANKLDFLGLFLGRNSGHSWGLFLWTVPTYESLYFFKSEIRLLSVYQLPAVIFTSWWVNGFFMSLDYVCWFISNQVRTFRLFPIIYLKISCVKYFYSTIAKVLIPYYWAWMEYII